MASLGFNVVAYSPNVLFENTFVFNTDKEAHDAYLFFEDDSKIL